MKHKQDSRTTVNVVTSPDVLSNWRPQLSMNFDVIFGNWALEYLNHDQIIVFVMRCMEQLSDNGLLILKQSNPVG